VEAEAVDPGPHVADLGPLSPPEREALESELDTGAPSQLAGTGHHDTQIFVGGLMVVLIGAGLVGLASWRRKQEPDQAE
jgi:hypothetical protein